MQEAGHQLSKWLLSQLVYTQVEKTHVSHIFNLVPQEEACAYFNRNQCGLLIDYLHDVVRS